MEGCDPLPWTVGVGEDAEGAGEDVVDVGEEDADSEEDLVNGVVVVVLLVWQLVELGEADEEGHYPRAVHQDRHDLQEWSAQGEGTRHLLQLLARHPVSISSGEVGAVGFRDGLELRVHASKEAALLGAVIAEPGADDVHPAGEVEDDDGKAYEEAALGVGPVLGAD